MFIGHFGIAMAGKRTAAVASLGTLFAAAQFADLLWPNLVLLGVEEVAVAPGITAVTPLDFISYPFSHSLLALCLWGTLFACLYWGMVRHRLSPAITVGLLIVSHWVLDVVTHRPDLPVLPGGPYVGLGLWNSVVATIVVEGALFAFGLISYVRTTRARDRIGEYGFWGLIVFLIVIAVANLVGPPPPSAEAVAWTAQAMWLLVLWGYWVDRHRISMVAL